MVAALGRSSEPIPEPGFDRLAITYETFSSRQDSLEISVDADQPLTVSYTEIGSPDGPAVVLMHGVPTSSWMYRYLIDELLEDEIRVIAIDNPGYGSSEKPHMSAEEATAFYTSDLQSRRIEAVLDELGVSEALFVVHDVGGAITWELLSRRPEMATGLVVLNTIGAPGGFSPPAAIDNAIVQAVMHAMAFRTDESIRSLICPMVVVRESIDTPVQLEGYYAPFRDGADVPYKAFLSTLDQIRTRLPAYQSVIEALDVPAAVYWGEQDVDLLADPSATWFANALSVPESRVTLNPEAKHLVAEEFPREIAELIREVVRLGADAGQSR